MAVEDNAEKIERLALVPVRGAPNPGHGRHMHVIFVEHHFQSQPMMFCRREQMVIDFKAGLFLGAAIKTTKV